MSFAAAILTLYPEMFPGVSFDSDGHSSQPHVFELDVDTRAKNMVNWRR